MENQKDHKYVCLLENDIRKIRSYLIKQLENYSGAPLDLETKGLNKKLIDRIIFDTSQSQGKKIVFTMNDHNILSKIDFKNVSFKNFACEGRNFRGLTGITLKPQELFDKRMNLVDLDEVTLELDERGFEGVEMYNVDFTGVKVKDNGPLIINPQQIKRKEMGGCHFNGVTFNGPFDGCNIRHANFAGSKGAIIDPQTIHRKSMAGTMLADTIIKNTKEEDSSSDTKDLFNEVNLQETDFTGSFCKEFINPQTIYEKSLKGTILKNANMLIMDTKDMADVEIRETDFTGINGEVHIDPQTIKDKSLYDAKLDGVTIDGSFDGCCIIRTDFAGAKGDIHLNPQTIKDKDLSGSRLVNITIDGALDDCNIKDTEVINCTMVEAPDIQKCEISKYTKVDGEPVYDPQFMDKVIQDIFDIIDKATTPPPQENISPVCQKRKNRNWIFGINKRV